MFLLRAHRPALYRERVELRLDIRREAQRIAAELDGVSADEIIAEAERIARDGVRP
jgi:type III secretion system FlhB-like substrate exporter